MDDWLHLLSSGCHILLPFANHIHPGVFCVGHIVIGLYSCDEPWSEHVSLVLLRVHEVKLKQAPRLLFIFTYIGGPKFGGELMPSIKELMWFD